MLPRLPASPCQGKRLPNCPWDSQFPHQCRGIIITVLLLTTTLWTMGKRAPTALQDTRRSHRSLQGLTPASLHLPALPASAPAVPSTWNAFHSGPFTVGGRAGPWQGLASMGLALHPSFSFKPGPSLCSAGPPWRQSHFFSPKQPGFQAHRAGASCGPLCKDGREEEAREKRGVNKEENFLIIGPLSS